MPRERHVQTNGPAPADGGGVAQENGFMNGVKRFAMQLAIAWLLSCAEAGTRVLIIYSLNGVRNVIKHFFSGNNTAKSPTPQPAGSEGVKPAAQDMPGAPDPFASPPVSIAPLWPVGSSMDMHVKLSTAPWDPIEPKAGEGLPSLVWRDIKYGDWNDQRVQDFEVDVPVVSALLPSDQKICRG